MSIFSNLPYIARARRRTAAGPWTWTRPIEVDGIVLGAVMDHELGVRFVAADKRVTDMDQSIWPNADYALRSARQLFRAGRAHHAA